MIVRRLRKEEMIDAARIRSISFHAKLNEEEAEKSFEKITEEQLKEQWGCFDEDGSMMACIVNNDFLARFDGQIVKLGGIGGVATLPEYRYGGAVKAIFGELLREARENGEVLSALYPFSHEFYRKVGYETIRPVVEYEFKPALVKGYRHTGWTKRLKKDESIEDMKHIYRAFSGKYNLMLERADGRYRIGDPFAEDQYTMLLGDERGARAYLYYRTDRDGGNVLNVRDIAFADAEGFQMCLGYIGRMSADYSKVRLTLPEDVPLVQLVPESYDIVIRFHQQPMARITNAQKALELMKKPEGAAFTVQVTDDFLPENSGVYRVTAEGAVQAEGTADLEVSGQALTLLALGALSLEEAAYRADVRINANMSVLSRVFIRKPLYIADYF